MKRCAIVLIMIMFTSSFVTFTPYLSGRSTEQGELEKNDVHGFASLNSTEVVTINSHPNAVTNSFKIEVPEGEAVRNLSLELSPTALPRSEGISFTSPNDFNQSGATAQGVDYNSSGLQVSAIDEYWSFEGSSGLPTGWSSSNANYGRINTLSCGTNGSSSRSLTVRHGSVSVTSNTIDLSSLSNGQISFWMREGQSGCGEDPDSSEHMFVEYIKSSGSWGQITYFNAGLGYPYYTPRNVAFNLPNDAFHSNFKFRFRLSHGSGTCCDWWFVDDVRLTKPGGEGNWTTPAFGPNASNANFRSLPGPYGVMSIDTDAPSNAVTWSVLDGSNDTPIDGFSERQGVWADLGGIDWQKHPAIRLKVTLEAMGTGSVTKVNGVHIQGRFVNSFDDNPSDWSLIACSWDGDSIVGDGEAYSPIFLSRRPISRISTALMVTGGGHLEATIDGAPWVTIPTSGLTNLDSWVHSIQFRWIGQGQSFDLQKFEVELHGSGLPESPLIDLGNDGNEEWGLTNDSIGTWGWQDVLANGNRSTDLKFPSQHNVELWIPKDSSGDFTFEISPELSTGVSNLQIQLLIGSNVISSWNFASGDASLTLQVEEADRANLVAELATSQPVYSQSGVEYVAAEMILDGLTGGVRFGGIAIPHSPSATLHFEPESDFILGLNNLAGSMTATDGWVTLPLSMSWTYLGSMEVTLRELNTGLATTISLESAANLSATLTPSWQMFEFEHNLTVNSGELAALRYDLVGVNNAVTYTVWVGASPLPADTLEGDGSAIILPAIFDTGAYSTPVGASGPGICCELNPTLRFSLNASWDDEELVTLTFRGVMKDGLISIPWVHMFGVGPSQGVENDMKITDWRVLNDRGIAIADETSYLKADSDISVEVEFGFDGLESMFAPRSDDIEVRLLENGIVKAQTNQLNQGVATFTTRTPMATGDIEYAVEFSPLVGGDDMTTIVLNRSFEIDSISPQVINQSVKAHDHLEPSLSQTLTFELYDMPVLPTDVTLMLWRQWQDDSDGDGEFDANEFQPQNVMIPDNLSINRGNYSFTFDDTFGLEGDLIAGYLTGSDPAGNSIIGGGSSESDSHLFVYQLMTDEAPSITRVGAGWVDGPRDWLHPSPTYGLIIPFEEANGFSDIDHITLNLGGNSLSDQLQIRWNASGGECTTSSPHMELINCHVRASGGNLTAFTSDMYIQIDFKLGWDLPDEGDLRREPDIEVVDRAGQGDWLALPELRWRFSTDLQVEPDSILVELAEGTRSASGAWVAPNSNITISGRVSFSPTGDLPTDEMKVKVLLDDKGPTVRTENGWWSATVKAPQQASSAIPLTFELTEIPAQARDVTDTGLTILYIIVDHTPPIPIEVVGPRIGSEIQVSTLSSLVVEIQVKEYEQLDIDTLRLNWVVTHGSNPYGDEIASGQSTVVLPAHNPAGEAIPVRATLELQSVIPAAMLSEELTLHVWITGQDMVGNEMVSDVQFNSAGSPFASWIIQQLQADLLVEDSDLSYSRSGEIELGDTVMVTVLVHNLGEVYGVAELTLNEVDSEGVSRVITPVYATVGVDPGGSSEAQIDWVPESEGHYFIVVIMGDNEVATGVVVTVTQPADTGILADLNEKGFSIEWIVILGGLLILLGSVVVIGMRAGGAPKQDWIDEEGDATAVVEAEFTQNQQWTPEQIAQWQQSQAQGMQNQQQWTPEQIAWWQQQQMQQVGQTQQGLEGYQQGHQDSNYQK
ncbi:MAG TPA: hypothetical protein EYN30_01385 [Candidatus Poseidoniales archaeon]|nr:hypothetical protein [Candidatus Poseidoniales archaeon]